jgi:hypothetical protein
LSGPKTGVGAPNMGVGGSRRPKNTYFIIMIIFYLNIKWIEYERKKTIKLSIASLETQFASVRSIQNMQHTWPPIPKPLLMQASSNTS